EEGCGFDSLAGLLGLEEGSSLSERCGEVLEKGLDQEACSDFSTLRTWVLCRARQFEATQKDTIKRAMELAWDEAEAKCKGFES
ncbi:hypothetical protein KAR91_06905, partial [Candidatus Pacearchaeota archaeon]|nr:hypothetical protein [Candidatus Pacearchaeota archaeon]